MKAKTLHSYRFAIYAFGILFVAIIGYQIYLWGAVKVKEKEAVDSLKNIAQEMQDKDMDDWYGLLEKHKDPWDNPISLSAESTQEHIVLISMGADGEEDTKDDIKHEWKKSKSFFSFLGF